MLQPLIILAKYLLQDSPLRCIRYVIGSLISGSLQVISMSAILPIINEVIGKEESQFPTAIYQKKLLLYLGLEANLTNYLLSFLSLALFSSLVFILLEMDKGRYILRLEKKIKHDLFDHVINARWNKLCKLNHGYLINGLTRESDNHCLNFYYFLDAISTSILIVSFLSMLVAIDVKLAFATMSLCCTSYLIVIPVLQISRKLGIVATSNAAKYSEIATNTSRGLKSIKAMSLEENVSSTVAKFIAKRALDYFKLNSILMPFRNSFFEFIGLLILCGLIFISFNVTQTPVEKLIIIIAILLKLIPMVSQFFNRLSFVYNSIASFDFIHKIKKDCGENNNSQNTQKLKSCTEIKFENVDFQYDEQHKILDSLNVHFKKGEFWAIRGATGTGKTSLLDLIGGLNELTQGQIFYESLTQDQLSKKEITQKVGYLSQNPYIFEGTLLENITWGLDSYSETVLNHAIEVSQLKELVEKKTLDFQVFESGQNLSGGQKQRIALARLFMRPYEFLLLDEPTSALDYETERKFLEALCKLKNEVGVIMITHNDEFLKYIDHTIIFEENMIKIT